MNELSPLEKVEFCYSDLVSHYANGENPELRAAAKLLLVALDRFRCHGGHRWDERVEDYLIMARDEPDKLNAILIGNRSVKAM